MRWATRDSSVMRTSVCSACRTALSAIREDASTWRPISLTDSDSSSVAVATDCMFDDASSEAPATWPDRLSVVSAVRVSVSAAVSSCSAEAATLETMPPTAPSKSSAKRINSARRASPALRFCASWLSASRSALAIACTLNSSTAEAMSPNSSRRPSPGSTTSKSPEASLRMAAHIAIIGRAMLRPSNMASTAPTISPPTPSMTIRRLVWLIVVSDSDSSRCCSVSMSAFSAVDRATIVSAIAVIFCDSPSTFLEFSTYFAKAP